VAGEREEDPLGRGDGYEEEVLRAREEGGREEVLREGESRTLRAACAEACSGVGETPWD
jgi:hypothetical protein